jgi:hypothetical protein
VKIFFFGCRFVNVLLFGLRLFLFELAKFFFFGCRFVNVLLFVLLDDSRENVVWEPIGFSSSFISTKRGTSIVLSGILFAFI